MLKSAESIGTTSNAEVNARHFDRNPSADFD